MKITAKMLAELLRKYAIVDADAIDNPEGYDDGETMQRIEDAADELNNWQ